MAHPQISKGRPKVFYLSKQVLKSWYIFYYQLPYIPEYKMAQNDFAFLTKSIGDHYTAEDFRRLKKYWSQPYALTSMINWYRYIVQNRLFKPKPIKLITIPVLLIFGTGDKYIEKATAEESMKKPFVENAKMIFYEDVSHWIQHEAKERVNDDVYKFISQ